MAHILDTIVEHAPLLISSAVAAVSAAVYLYGKVFKPIWAMFKQHTLMYDKVNTIFEEMRPNGGKSIKDIIINMHKNVSLVGERQRALMADSKEAMFETDSEGRCIWVNRTYTRLVQLTPIQLLGFGWHNVIYPEDKDKVISEWQKAVKDKREFIIRCRLIAASGEVININCKSYVLSDSAGNTIGYLGFIVKDSKPE